MTESTNVSGSQMAGAQPVPGASALRKINPLVATAAIAVTAVCVIAAVQFLSPQNARSAAKHDSASNAAHNAAAPAPGAAAMAPAPVAACPDCGEVVNIRTSRQEGSGTGVGAVAGGVLGGVLGHQMGAGRGKEAMTVVGAVGGAVAGNEVEKQVKAQTLYLIDVRMSDGSARTITQTTPPNLAIGAKVQVSGNTIALR